MATIAPRSAARTGLAGGLASIAAFRPLILFWACLLALAAAGALTLQILGPVKPKLVATPQAAAVGSVPTHPRAVAAILPPEEKPAVAAPLKPASPQAVTGHGEMPARKLGPAPKLEMTLGAIPEPDPRMLEPSGYEGRMLPVPAGGRIASAYYAAAFDPSERHPRIAMVIDGMGLDRGVTAQAGRSLPAAVDFAYSAYAPSPDADRLAQAGRRMGRECLVSIPMEPNGFPANEEGEKSLLTGADPRQSRQNLNWAMAGVRGCVGATGASDGLAGERFAESEQAFDDVLTAVAQRGLIYLDPRPAAPPPADATPGRRLPYVTDVVVDHALAPERPADAQTIDHNLAELEQVAARKGAAVGLAGPPTPVLLDRINVWAHGLAARGFVLAPLTAIPPPSPAPVEAAR